MSGIAVLDPSYSLGAERWNADKYPTTYTPEEKMPTSHEEMEKRVQGPLAERVQVLSESEWLLDSMVRIKGVPDSDRKTQSQLWNRARVLHLTLRDTSVSIFAPILIFPFMMKTTIVQSAIFITVAFATAVFGGYQWWMAQAALKERKKWDTSPVEVAANLRTQAYRGNLPQENVLHPNERETLMKQKNEKTSHVQSSQ